jgi:hypothetical protein
MKMAGQRQLGESGRLFCPAARFAVAFAVSPDGRRA